MTTLREPYEQYRGLLTTLANDDIPLTLLDEAARHCGWWRSHRPWQRTYGRFHLGDCHLLTLIYETLDGPQEICVIDLFTSFPRTFDPSQTVLRREGLGWFCLTRFPHDPQLPALPRLLQPGAGQAQVLRYRPHKRCTIRFSGLAEGAPSDGFADDSCFAKHFPDERGAELHAESVALWQASRRGELSFAVAPPIRWDEAQQTLWQGVVPGRPVVERLLSNEGPTLANQIGRAAASLPCAALQPSQRSDARKQLKRSARYVRRLADFFPNLRPALDLLMDRLVTIQAGMEEQPLRPIHGAPHPHQWLDDNGHLGLVDFDGFALGDPELDVATFLAEMDFEDWERVPVAAINRAFQAGYEAVYGPLNPQLLNAYRAHKRLSKALRNAYAIRGDNDMRVERALGQALVLVC
ncbi:MAG: phosphotransferase [Caldilineaceae bacterium]|nr:phosphotransferase [Caldilineaceae bacterium]